jgi:methyl-accepting chemotaxis protein
MLDRRRTDRNGMIKSGRIVFDRASLRCAVLDVSETGARVHVKPMARLPELIILQLPDRTTRAARVCWQEGSEIGLEFVLGFVSPANDAA